jgi:hypothetical protein
MSDPSDTWPRLPSYSQLAERSHSFAAQLYSEVGQQYLAFRREYWGDPTPNLATVPPRSTAVQQTDGARVAAAALRAIPSEVRHVAVLGDIFDHLQWEVDIHTLTERERLDLHNLTMGFLYGVREGIQPWYVEWMLGAAHRLHGPVRPDYYLAFPWHGLFYRSPEELAGFDRAVASADVEGIQQEVGKLTEALTTVLRDPLGSQIDLAFTGPEAERRKTLFTLETAAGLALGAYVAAAIVHDVLSPQRPAGPPQALLPELPSQLEAELVPEGART